MKTTEKLTRQENEIKRYHHRNVNILRNTKLQMQNVSKDALKSLKK